LIFNVLFFNNFVKTFFTDKCHIYP
jgi:hypothetical protein